MASYWYINYFNANDIPDTHLKLNMTELYKQAAAIPFREKDNNLEILLITSRSKKKWIIPKGLIDPGDSAPFTALKETIEEAGVKGEVFPESIGTFEYLKWGGICKVSVFAMLVDTVMDAWEEMDFRKRRWFDIEDAIKRVKPTEVKSLIRIFGSNRINKNL